MDINRALAARKSLQRRDIHTEISGKELDIVKALGIKWPPEGRRTHIRCPIPGHPDKDPSWRFDGRSGRYFCTCSYGSVVDLVMAMRGLNFKEACAYIRGESLVRVASAPPPVMRKIERTQDKAAYQRQQQKKALHLWGGSLDPADSPVEVYWRDRRLTGTIPLTIRYLPAKPPDHPWPCMIGAYGLACESEPGVISMPQDRIQAVHLTKLAPDGRGKAPIPKNEQRRTVGSPMGCPIVLAPPGDGLGLAILEGIEKALAYHRATGLGVWAAGAAGFMPALADKVPDYVECVTIWREADKAGRDGADGLKDRLLDRDFEVVTVEAA